MADQSGFTIVKAERFFNRLILPRLAFNTLKNAFLGPRVPRDSWIENGLEIEARGGLEAYHRRGNGQMKSNSIGVRGSRAQQRPSNQTTCKKNGGEAASFDNWMSRVASNETKHHTHNNKDAPECTASSSSSSSSFVFLTPGAGILGLNVCLTAGFPLMNVLLALHWGLEVEESLHQQEYFASWVLLPLGLCLISAVSTLNFALLTFTTDPGYTCLIRGGGAAPLRPFPEATTTTTPSSEAHSRVLVPITERQQLGEAPKHYDSPQQQQQQQQRVVQYSKSKLATQRFCHKSSCQEWMPLRAVHCRTCDVCVVGWDHHCGLLGCCVGFNNLRWFLCCMVSGCLEAFWLFFLAIVHLINADSQESRSAASSKKCPTAVADLHSTIWFNAIMGFCATFTLGLFVFMCWMVWKTLYGVARQVTTFERERKVYQQEGSKTGEGSTRGRGSKNNNTENPFDEGLVANFRRLWSPRLWVPGEDRSFV